ncbi:hypothetical protein ACFPIJ_08875 [Dactylosporangium cerinum]|uniref:Uncharacterized protein n=1 Tax=Dactylosporangium cerinum TaxID=1434730 RepID=A0ABV9VQI8_9ACTN
MSTALFDHALRLQQLHPDTPLPRDGEPFPDEAAHPDRQPARTREGPRRKGAGAAAVLDAHFADADATPADLVDAFHDVYVPIHRNDHIAAAALRAGRKRVRRTGRWLVRHSTDRCSVTVGLALLATDHDDRDIPLIQTIGLLSEHFGALAAEALQRRRDGGPALLWLAQRTAGWGRVYVIEAMCRRGVHGSSRDWLLRHACDGDFLAGYYAGKVAIAAQLHPAIVDPDADEALIDHTGRILSTMADCSGMGSTLEHYPSAAAVLTAHAGHLGRLAPTVHRYVTAATIADHLAKRPPERNGCTPEQRDGLVRQYLAVLDRQDWCDTARAGLAPDDGFTVWFVAETAARLRLRAFSGTGADPRAE